MTKPLLIEIGVEELPAIPFLKELPNIEKKWLDILEKNALKCDFDFFYTPRRLVIWSEHFLLKQADSFEEFFGAPLEIAYKDEEPTNAALGFARKCGVDISEIKSAKKGSKEVLYYKKSIKGKESKELLGDMVDAFLKNLNFGKSMRWGEEKDSFIRPIRWLSCSLGDKHVDFELFGVKTQKLSFGHRALGYESFEYKDAKEYFEKLTNKGVILFQDDRKKIILDQMEELEKKHKISIEKDQNLLDEVIAITEYPKALLGKFSEHFLTLPPEVIITSMKEHQRYFPCFENGKLTNKFIVVSNSLSKDGSLIVDGNERVLHARLSDGLFFWENDIKNGLSTKGLENVVFLDGLGSLFDKAKREEGIGEYLAKKYILNLSKELPKLKEDEILALLDKTISLSKADLLSEMVYEFTELQGLMGYYYAKVANEDQMLALGLKEQYLPDAGDGKLPSKVFSSIVALSHKIDTLMALFSINKIPTGTKDPFALRRAVVGIIKIVLEYELGFDIDKDFANIASNYNTFDMQKLQDFVIERMYSHFEVNPSVLKAVLESGEKDILKISQKVKALEHLVKSKAFKEGFSTFKRVANIIKNVDTNQDLNINENLLQEEQEKALYKEFKSIKEKSFASYEENLDALFGLKKHIDNFFDNVMVNVEDEKLKQNRQNLIGKIYQEFKQIADIKEISI